MEMDQNFQNSDDEDESMIECLRRCMREEIKAVNSLHEKEMERLKSIDERLNCVQDSVIEIEGQRLDARVTELEEGLASLKTQ